MCSTASKIESWQSMDLIDLERMAYTRTSYLDGFRSPCCHDLRDQQPRPNCMCQRVVLSAAHLGLAAWQKCFATAGVPYQNGRGKGKDRRPSEMAGFNEQTRARRGLER